MAVARNSIRDEESVLQSGRDGPSEAENGTGMCPSEENGDGDGRIGKQVEMRAARGVGFAMDDDLGIPRAAVERRLVVVGGTKAVESYERS